MTVRIYYNPSCSKCCQTLELLHKADIQPEIVEYLTNPPTREELIGLLDMLDLQPRQLMRTKEAEYKENGLDDPNLTDDELIDAMLRIPKLMERPVVVNNGQAAIGRPPENIKAIL